MSFTLSSSALQIAVPDGIQTARSLRALIRIVLRGLAERAEDAEFDVVAVKKYYLGV